MKRLVIIGVSLGLLFFAGVFFLAAKSGNSDEAFSKKLLAPPPSSIPEELWKDFTLNGQIPVWNYYFDGTYSTPKVYTKTDYDAYIQKSLRREVHYYGETDTFLYQALDEMANEIRGKEVGVIGSVDPWYEGILLSYGAKPVVIEYNLITTSDSRVTYLTPSQFSKNPRKFDLVLSISSTEHDGLGRYGDPIDPDGDLKSMCTFKEMLTPNGKLLIAVPVGQDALVWNAHRIYGPKRLKLLFKGWKPIKYYGFSYDQTLNRPLFDFYQPVFLLEPKHV